jgi:hypothetical protein
MMLMLVPSLAVSSVTVDVTVGINVEVQAEVEDEDGSSSVRSSARYTILIPCAFNPHPPTERSADR